MPSRVQNLLQPEASFSGEVDPARSCRASTTTMLTPRRGHPTHRTIRNHQTTPEPMDRSTRNIAESNRKYEPSFPLNHDWPPATHARPRARAIIRAASKKKVQNQPNPGSGHVPRLQRMDPKWPASSNPATTNPSR